MNVTLPSNKQTAALTKYSELSMMFEDDEIKEICTTCQPAGVTINLGISERIASGFTPFKSQVTIDSDGTILSAHRKLQPTYSERFVWGQ
ncbi:hypothetical protein ACJ72_01587 [Emergomyces africanus]|uniref:CN hydrolase domain-containing protein n=1 Tax=Emergomyces africanus TaxID=1955775 RepID=A0A1B7P4T7_9EURO|nr:hypothetical protein ACJ72_01587 [Emergomyces africanus]